MTTYNPVIQVLGIMTQAGQSGGGTVLSPSTNPIDIAFGESVMLFLAANGEYDIDNDNLTGSFTEGSFVIEDVETPAAYGIVPGQYIFPIGASPLPNGPINTITAVGTSSITFTNLTPSGPLGALSTATNVPFTIVDEWPLGSLKVTSSPALTVGAIQDFNFDGTTNPNNVGNGQAISNLAGQAIGNVWLAFYQVGTYTISVEYLTGDANYVDTTASNLVTVVVS